MANEEEMESFDVSEQDLCDALQPGKQRYRNMTRDEQIYGVFSQDESYGPSSSTYSRSDSSKKSKHEDASTPVGFVRGNLSTSQQGAKPKSVEADSSSKFEDRNSRNKLKSTNLGEWEKHTKGIGAKLLLQMGYQPGKGLGRALQGRSLPVEAQVRKGRGAVGLYGAENKGEPSKVLSDDEEGKVFQEKLAHWKRDSLTSNSVGKSGKTKFIYRTSEEIVDEATKSGIHKMARDYSEISKAKVIDMTGREQRVLYGYTALGAKKTAEPDDAEAPGCGILKDKFQLEKLSYNLDTIVDFCEHEIIQNAKELSYTQDQLLTTEAEVKNYSSIVSKEVDQIGMLTAVLEVLERLEKKRTANLLEVDFLWQQLSCLEKQHPEEYNSFGFAHVTLTYLIPLMKIMLSQSWRPFDSMASDETCRSSFHQWRTILEFRSENNTFNRRGLNKSVKGIESKQIDPYHGLIWHAWMPAFRGLVGQWACKNSEPMVLLLNSWEPLLPEWIIDNILDQLILPKIKKEVEMWNPLTDLIPIHMWTHTWLPRLGSKLEIVYPGIRQKMARALVDWIPSDKSARSVLLPWVPVFSKGAMDAFLLKNILPKLQIAIQKWDINPNQQQLDVWNWIMDWRDLIPIQSMVALLVEHFFPRWLHVLVTWLNHIPNYEEIVVWYTGWKSLFPPELAQHPNIQEQFTRALDLMNRALAVGGQVDLACPPPAVMASAIRPPPTILIEPVVPQGFRELVEYRCSQLGIICIPLVNRFQAGRPIFRVGNVLSYFDRQVAFVLANGVWIPVSVQQLLEMAVS